MLKLNNPLLKTYFLSLLFAAVILFNIIGLKRELSSLIRIQKRTPYMAVGAEFEGLKPLIKDQPYISYYSDTLKTSDESKKLMAQAQYVLVPTAFDDQNLNHPMLLLICSSTAVALQKAKEFGYTPLKSNNRGMILAAKNP